MLRKKRVTVMMIRRKARKEGGGEREREGK
jgi:hypothetical protein